MRVCQETLDQREVDEVVHIIGTIPCDKIRKQSRNDFPCQEDFTEILPVNFINTNHVMSRYGRCLSQSHTFPSISKEKKDGQLTMARILREIDLSVILNPSCAAELT